MKWCKIYYNGQYCWGSKSYFDITLFEDGSDIPEPTPIPTPSPTPTPEPTPSVSGDQAIGEALCLAKVRMNLRKGPGTSYKKTGSLPAKSLVYIYEISGDWYRIKYDGSFHWAIGDYLKVTLYKDIVIDPNVGDVTALGLTETSMHIRSGPGTSYESLGTVIGGSLIEIYQENAEGYWHLINYNGEKAYISGKYVDVFGKPAII